MESELSYYTEVISGPTLVRTGDGGQWILAVAMVADELFKVRVSLDGNLTLFPGLERDERRAGLAPHALAAIRDHIAKNPSSLEEVQRLLELVEGNVSASEADRADLARWKP